jgi:ATP-dependent helicase Lhr and Lhr-like helicase
MLFVGPEAERRYGRRHFMELMSVFTYAVLHAALDAVAPQLCHPNNTYTTEVTRRAVQELKFADLLPENLAQATLSERIADHAGADTAAKRQRVERWSK